MITVLLTVQTLLPLEYDTKLMCQSMEIISLPLKRISLIEWAVSSLISFIVFGSINCRMDV